MTYHFLPKDHAYRMVFRLFLLFLVTSPWLFRRKLPVHSFSDNWRVHKREKEKVASHFVSSIPSEDMEILLYQIKKWQYVFYKHVVLHGINILVAVADKLPASAHPPYSLSWRVFWLLLNTSYVMEFFLQSLVKRRTIISQGTMLVLQRWLMASASAGATVVLFQLSRAKGTELPYLLPLLSLASLTLSFINRHHDVLNTMSIALVAYAVLHLSDRWGDY